MVEILYQQEAIVPMDMVGQKEVLAMSSDSAKYCEQIQRFFKTNTARQRDPGKEMKCWTTAPRAAIMASQQWFQDWRLHGKILKKASFAAESQAPVLAFTFYGSKSGRSTMLAHAILNLPSLGQLVRASIPPPGTLQSFNTSQELWWQCSMCWNQSAFRRHATIEYKMRQTAEGSWDCKRSEQLRRFQARTF